MDSNSEVQVCQVSSLTRCLSQALPVWDTVVKLRATVASEVQAVVKVASTNKTHRDTRPPSAGTLRIVAHAHSEISAHLPMVNTN